jgi:trimeric autotransporter adhesin
VTPESTADPETRLAIYGTGFRHAESVTALAQDAAGNRYWLTVEYAGAAPGFFGLDQVNVVLPAGLDVAGTVSLSLATDTAVANTVTIEMKQIAASALAVSSLAVSPTFLNAGSQATLTVGLNGNARAGGYAVSLRSGTMAASVPASVTIAEGKATATATVSTSTVVTSTTATLTAQAGSSSQTATLAIDPASTVSLTALTAGQTVLGGRTVTGTLSLSGAAPVAGVTVAVASDNTNAKPPATVTISFNRSSADFSITTSPVTSSQTATLTATLGHISKTATITMVPAIQLTLTSSTVTGGSAFTGTVTLADAAPIGGATVTFKTSDSSVQVAPVVVIAGQTAQTFSFPTTAVAASRTVTITASYGANSQTATVTVNPPDAIAVSSLTISPTSVKGGATAQATVTLNRTAGSSGVYVTLQSSNVLTANAAPNFFIIPPGATSHTFTIGTSGFPAVVTFTATANGSSKTATLTVQ